MVPGPHAQSRRLTEYIKGLGDRFQVVVLSVKSDNSHIQRYHGARLLRVPVGSGDLPARAQAFDRAVRRQLESEEYLLVHFFDPFGGYALCERRSELGYRVVYDACTFPSVELPLSHPSLESNRKFIARLRRQELFCLMNADAVITGSAVAQRAVVELGVPENRVHVIRAPVDLEPYTAAAMGQPDGMPMRMLHLGSENPWAGLNTVIQALGQVASSSAHLTIAGPRHPEEHTRLVETVAALKLEAQVDFQAPVAHDDLHKVLAVADTGLVTMSDVERNRSPGGPLARLGEYLAAGRPVIAADLPLARELVPAEAALFYRAGDAASLAAAISALANDQPRRLKMGLAARKAAEAFDASAARGALLDVYTLVAGPVAITTPDDEQSKVPSGGGQVSEGVTQLGEGAFEGAASGPSHIGTDPQIAHAEGSTDPQREHGRPAVMGVPLREEAPVVVGQMLPAQAEAELDQALNAVTDIELQRRPVVMGSPLSTPSTTGLVPWPQDPPPHPAPVAGIAWPSASGPSRSYPFTLSQGVDAAPRTLPASKAVPPSSRSTLPARSEPRTAQPVFSPPKQALALGAQPVPERTSTVIVDDSLFEDEARARPPTAPSIKPGSVASTNAPAPMPSPAVTAPPPPAPPPAAVFTKPPPLRSSPASFGATAKSSNSGIQVAPANAFAGIALPPISAPPPLPRPPNLIAKAPPARAPVRDEIEEVGNDEVMDVVDEPSTGDGWNDEVMDSDGMGVDSASGETLLPPSALDPWLAQLVHGYCPPESQLFARHVPPTTMPGRD